MNFDHINKIEPRLSNRGTIYNGFIQKINGYFNYYDYKQLEPYIYIYEILKKLFNDYWVTNTRINHEATKKIIEFNEVVKYYLEIELKDYISDFIGSSYGCEQFIKSIESIIKP